MKGNPLKRGRRSDSLWTLGSSSNGISAGGSKQQHEKGRSFSQPVARQRLNHLENYILPDWGDRLLRDLDGFEIEQWLLRLKLSNQTRIHIRSSFNIVMKTARRQRLIKHNPIDDCEPLPIRWEETASFSPAEIAKLFPKNIVKLQQLWSGEPDTLLPS
jgi:hypothetical protein